MSTKTERDKHADDVEQLQRENDERRREYRPPEVHVEVPATSASGEDEKAIEVHAFGGHCYVNTHGEARLSQDGVFNLIGQLQAAFQAVS